jgi:polysaccharide export outer membrane protein
MTTIVTAALLVAGALAPGPSTWLRARAVEGTQAPVAAPTPTVPVQQPAGPSPVYQVGPGDTIRVTVLNEPDLTGTFRVDDDGSIAYPLLGRVQVNRKTAREVEDLLRKLLQDGYVNRPQVTAEIGEYRSRFVYVMGEVRTPGKYPIEGEATLLDVLAKAGSLTATASNTVRVLRQRDPAATGAPALPGAADVSEVLVVNLDDLKSGKMAGANMPLQDGDTILVPQADRFYISGYVRNPGTFVLQPNMTVEQAIAVAGGLSERGSRRGIRIRRTVKGKEVEVNASPTTRVLPGDTILIRQRLI